MKKILPGFDKWLRLWYWFLPPARIRDEEPRAILHALGGLPVLLLEVNKVLPFRFGQKNAPVRSNGGYFLAILSTITVAKRMINAISGSFSI